MKEAIKAELIEALRTRTLRGKAIRPAIGFLGHRGNGAVPDSYCASGIVCHIAAEEGVIEERVMDGGFLYYYWGEKSGQNSGGFMPQEVYNWAGMEFFHSRKIQAMNDKRENWNDIADWVEENL